MALDLSIILTISFLFFSICLLLRRQHLLSTLINLEALLLLMVGIISYANYMQQNKLYFSMIMLLTMGVCSASIGLSILIGMSRNYGNDSCNTMTSNVYT